MKAVYIYPEDIGAIDQWSSKWIAFCTQFGYTEQSPPGSLLVTNIIINQ